MPISRKLVSLIEDNADSLTMRCVKHVRSHPGTPTYRDYDPEKLYERAYRVYSQLGRWISRETTKAEVAKMYTALGAQRREEGFGASEVVQALTIIRRVLWFKIEEEGFLDNALDLHLALELSNLVVQFFDRAIYFAMVGFEQSEAAALETSEALSKAAH